MVEKPVYKEIIIEEEVLVETENDVVIQEQHTSSEVVEHDDSELTSEIY